MLETIDDDFWALIEPLIPARSLLERRSAGRPRAPDRAVFSGIVFVLRSRVFRELCFPKLSARGCSFLLLPAIGRVAGKRCGQESSKIAHADELQRRGCNATNTINGSLSVSCHYCLETNLQGPCGLASLSAKPAPTETVRFRDLIGD